VLSDARAPRRQVLVAAVGPTARAAHLGSAALTVALAAVPALVAVGRGHAEVSGPLVLSCLVAAAALAWAVDDPAADLLDSMPVSSPVRTRLRVVFVAGIAALGAAAVWLLVALGPGLPSERRERIPEAAAAAALALAVGLVAARRGERGAGAVGVTAGVLGTAVVAALAHRWPDELPTFAISDVHERWWVVAAVGAAVALRAGRDPARR